MNRFLNEHQIDDTPHSGQPVTTCTPECLVEIEAQIIVSLYLLVRKVTSCMHSSRSLVQCTLCGLPFIPITSCPIKNLKCLITKTDLIFVSGSKTVLTVYILETVFFTDEEWAHLDMHTNAQNF